MEELFNEQNPAPAPTGKMPGQPEFNETMPSEQEQADYDQVVTKAMSFMSQNVEAVLASINNKAKPVHENVGEMAVKIIEGIETQASAAEVQLGADIMMSAGEEVIEHLMELGDNGGIFPFDQESEEYDQVQAMAALHGAKVAGEKFIASPGYTDEVKDEAGTIFAQQVAEEQQRGEVDPSFHDNLGNQSAAATQRAIQGR